MNFIHRINKEFLKEELRDYAIIFALSTIAVYFTCSVCFISYSSAVKNSLFSFLAWTLLWKGNAYISNFLNREISWITQTLRRFILGMVFMIIYTILVLLLIQYFFYLVGYTSAKIAPVGAFLLSIGITVLISLILHSVGFLKSWRKAELLNEKLKNERLSSQYEALKNQVNPHFLFNSLNALTSLVYEDQDQAAKFIQQLSKVYRYVLDNREKETVSLETELKFVESYLYLQKIRYGDNLQYSIRKDEIDGIMNYLVAPLSVQMLVENAIKHNIISSEEPLTIKLEINKEGYLVTTNNLQIKNIINEYSGIGLENIKARYFYFTQRPVIVNKTNQEFTVKLPLISPEERRLKAEVESAKDLDKIGLNVCKISK